MDRGRAGGRRAGGRMTGPLHAAESSSRGRTRFGRIRAAPDTDVLGTARPGSAGVPPATGRRSGAEGPIDCPCGRDARIPGKRFPWRSPSRQGRASSWPRDGVPEKPTPPACCGRDARAPRTRRPRESGIREPAAGRRTIRGVGGRVGVRREHVMRGRARGGERPAGSNLLHFRRTAAERASLGVRRGGFSGQERVS